MTSQSKEMEKQTAKSLPTLPTLASLASGQAASLASGQAATTLAAQPRISPDRLRAHHAFPITDGPFTETKELLGGRTPINAKRR